MRTEPAQIDLFDDKQSAQVYQSHSPTSCGGFSATGANLGFAARAQLSRSRRGAPHELMHAPLECNAALAEDGQPAPLGHDMILNKVGGWA